MSKKASVMSIKNKSPLVSVIILNWRKPKLTIDCIEAIKKQSYTNIEIIVIENGSGDDSLNKLSKVKGINLIESSKNLGFAGGVNFGISKANGEFIFLINNDAIPEENYIKLAVHTIQQDKSTAAVGGKQYRTSSNLKNNINFLSYQIINPSTFDGVFCPPDEAINIIHEVNWVSGAALLLKKSALDEVGLFYERFFAYYEESDLFARLQAHDYKIVYNPDLKIVHADAASSTSRFQHKYLYRNRLLYGMRNTVGFLNSFKFAVKYLLGLIKLSIRLLIHPRKNYDLIMVCGFALVRFPYNIIVGKFSGRKNKRIDSEGHSLQDRLRISLSPIISFVYTIETKNTLLKFEKFINSTLSILPRSEFILLTNKSFIKQIRQFASKNHFEDSCRILTIQDPANKKVVLSSISTQGNLWKLRQTQFPSVKKIKSVALDLIKSRIPEEITYVRKAPYEQRLIVQLISWPFTKHQNIKQKFSVYYNILFSLITRNRHRLNETITYVKINSPLRKKRSSAAKIPAPQDVPVFIISKNRVSSLRKLVNWLESKNMTNIFIVDNGSTYEPLLKYYDSSPYQILPMGSSAIHSVVWDRCIACFIAKDKHYVVTDSDIVPDQKCPDDVVEFLTSRLHKYPDYIKIGLGLRIDDLPDSYALKSDVAKWESQFWEKPLEENVYIASTDTTFAMYQPGVYHYSIDPSLRAGFPYVARHLPWYVDSNNISSEEKYYREHAKKSITSWNVDELPDRYKEAFEAKK